MRSKRDLTIRFRKPEFKTFAIAYLVIGYVIHIFNLTVRHFIANTHKLDTLFVYALLMLLLAMVIREAISRIKAWQVIGVLAEIFILVVFMVASSDSETHRIVLSSVLTDCIPMFFCGACIYDSGKVRDGLIRVMTVIPYCYLLMTVLFGLNILAEGEGYSQSDSYTMLFLSVVLTSALFERFSVKHLIPLGISMFYMVAYGARGPIACWLLFVVLQIIVRLSREKILNQIGFIAFIGVVGAIVLKNYYSILLWLQRLFEQFGFSIRVVDRLLQKNFLEDKGRNRIAEICLERIQSNPIIGTGPVNDRIYITSHLGGGESAIGNYPHNIFLEFLMQYGVILGGVLLLLIAWTIFKSYRVSPDASSKAFILILVGTYLFPLFFSGSYLDYRGFYLLMAVCVTTLINYRKAQSSKQGVSHCGEDQSIPFETMESNS